MRKYSRGYPGKGIWIPLFLVSTAFGSAISQPEAHAEQDSTRTSSRNPARSLPWSPNLGASVPMDGNQGRIDKKMHWPAESADSSRRDRSDPHSNNRSQNQAHSNPIPWQQVGKASTPVDSVATPVSEISTRMPFRNHGSWKSPASSTSINPRDPGQPINWQSTGARIGSRQEFQQDPAAAEKTSRVARSSGARQADETIAPSADRTSHQTQPLDWSNQSLPAAERLSISDYTAWNQEDATETTVLEEPIVPGLIETASEAAESVAALVILENRSETEPNFHTQHQLIEWPVKESLNEQQTLLPLYQADNSSIVGDQGSFPTHSDSPAIPALLTAHPSTHGIPASLEGISASAQGNPDPIHLGPIPVLESETASQGPIGVLPIARLTQSSTARAVSATYSTEKYTGPMASADELFLDLHVSGDYQLLSGQPLQAQRTSPDNDSSGYTWMPGVYTWASPSFFHRPLYFEQANLERYGMGPRHCSQPLFSGMHFFSSIALMPYKLMTQHPNERVYSLGNQRPGDAACYQGRSLLGQSYVGETCRYWDQYGGYR